MKRTFDLRTGRPVWMAYRAPSVPCTRLVRDTRTDVLVVGMGVSGAMVAESLTAAGFRVILLDRRGPLLGSTPASTALVQYEIDVPLSRLSRTLGRERSEQAWRRSRLAVANPSARIDELGISCGKVDRISLLLAGHELGASGLRAEDEAFADPLALLAPVPGRPHEPPRDPARTSRAAAEVADLDADERARLASNDALEEVDLPGREETARQESDNPAGPDSGPGGPR